MRLFGRISLKKHWLTVPQLAQHFSGYFRHTNHFRPQVGLMWRVARAAHDEPDDLDDLAALFPDAVEEARDGLPNEPHPRVQLEDAVWYEVMHNKEGWANCGDFYVFFWGRGWEVKIGRY